MKAILGAVAVLFVVGCASAPSPEPVHYAIATANGVTVHAAQPDVERLQALRAASPADLLWFERDGARYLVTDPETVGRAAKASANLERAYAALQRELEPFGASSIVRFYTSGTTLADQAPPRSAPADDDGATQQQVQMERRVDNQLPRYTHEVSEEQSHRRKLQERVTRAERRVRNILDDALRSGLAQPAG